MAVKEFKKVPKDKLLKLKYLTNWLISPYKDFELLVSDKDEFNNNLKYRLFNHILNNPKVCYYINKHLNDIYIFHNFEPREWLFTFATILKLSQIKSTNQLYFSKFNIPKRNQFTNLILDYIKTVNANILNQDEINHLFLLFENNIITTKDIENLQLLISGKENKPDKITDFETIELTAIEKSSAIVNYSNSILTNINNRIQCKSCPSYKKGSLIIETNITEVSNVDVLIYCNISPNRDEIKSQEFLVNHRKFKQYLINIFNNYNLNYAFVNKVLCNITNLEDSAVTKKIISNCSGMANLVHHIFNGKLKIILGTKLAREFNIKSPVKQMGNLIHNEYFVLYHPDELSDKKNEKVTESLTKLDHILSLLKIKNKPPTNNTEETPTTTLISSNIKKYTLFDIQIIENKIIYIVLDENGNKDYIYEDVIFPVYIKKGSFKECEFISTNTDYILNLNLFEKQILQQKLNENLKKQILKNNIIEEEADNETEIQFDNEMFEL